MLHFSKCVMNLLNSTTSRRFKCVFQKCVITSDFFAWRLNLFFWASLSVVTENESNNFGLILFKRVEIFLKYTKKVAEATSKDWNNGTIKIPWANGVVNVSFCLDLRMNSSCNLRTFYGFSFFAMYFKLPCIFTNKERVESFKKRLWKSCFDRWRGN